MTSAGRASVAIEGDFSSINKQIAGMFSGSAWSKKGKIAGAGLAAGIAAAGVGKALFDIGAQFDEATDKIRVGTGKTGKQLAKLERSFKNVIRDVPTDFDSASEAITGLNQRLGLTGKPLERMTKQITELSRITDTDVATNVQTVTRAFGDWEVKTKDQSKTLDFFFKASQKSGAAVSDLAAQVVQFGAPLRQIGFSLEESTAMFAQFEKAGVNTSTMMPGLKMALKTFLTNDIDPEKGMARAFADIESGAMKTSDALDLFGTRAGADMVEAIQQGRFDLDQFTKSIARSDDTVRKAGKQTMDFGEQWTMFKNNVLLALEPVATRVFDGIGDAMKEVTDIMSDPRLTSGEKFEALLDKLGQAASDAIPMIAEAGVKAAEAFVKAFLNAGIWGNLAVGALVLRHLSKAIPAATTAGGDTAVAFGSGWKGMIGRVGIAGAAVATLQATMTSGGILDTVRGEGATWGRDFAEGFGAKFSAILKETVRRKSLPELEKLSDGLHDMARQTEDMDSTASAAFKNMAIKTDAEMVRVRAAMIKTGGKAKDFARQVKAEIASIDTVTEGALDNVFDNLYTALGALGIDRAGIKLSFKKGGYDKNATAGFLLKARGGHINVGAPSGDSVPALLERDEYVLNREAVKAVGKRTLDAINFGMAPRFQSGGVVQALGPYNIPPFVYDPDHAGGNSHWHIAMSSPAAVVAIGKRLQQMGFSVSEHPAFGGVNFKHSATGGHYDGLSIDVNDYRPGSWGESLSESRQVAALLGGGNFGNLGNIAKPRISGKGPLGDIVRGAVDKVHGAAGKFLRSRTMEGPEPGVGSAGGSGGSRGAIRALLHRTGMPDIMGHVAYAESGFDPNARNPSGASGLWQIMMPLHSGLVSRFGGNVFDPLTNARVAASLYGSSGLVPWAASKYEGHGGGWAQHLGQAFQRGGIVGAGRGTTDLLKRLWAAASPHFGGVTMPPTRLKKKLRGDAAGIHGWGAGGRERVLLSKKYRHYGGSDAYFASTALHEWAHQFQSGRTLNKPYRAEGGATGFEMIFGPDIAKSAGIKDWRSVGAITSLAPKYYDYFNRINRELGTQSHDWFKHGQFGHGATRRFQRGGIVGMQSGGDPFHVPGTPSMYDEGLFGGVKIRGLNGRIGRLDELIQIATAVAAYETSPGGIETSSGERAKLVGLNSDLLLALRQKRLLLKHRIKVGKGFKPAVLRGLHKQLDRVRLLHANYPNDKNLSRAVKTLKAKIAAARPAQLAAKSLGTNRSELDLIQGVTGKGGRIFDVQGILKALNYTPPADPTGGAGLDLSAAKDEQIRLLIEQNAALLRAGAVARLQDPIFGDFFRGLPKFHSGDVVPGPVGAPRPIMAAGGEGVFTPDQMAALNTAPPEVHVYIGERELTDVVRVEVRDETGRMVRSARSGPAVGVKAR